MSNVRYRVSHKTTYAYAGPVAHAHHLLHLMPRPTPWQSCNDYLLEVSPVPALNRREVDGCGNPVTRIELDRPHERLEVTARMQVELQERPRPDFASGEAWESVRSGLQYHPRALPEESREALRYRVQSPLVPIKRAFGDFAAECFPAGLGVLAGAHALMQKVHGELDYSPGTTDIATPLREVLELRAGVCQDYAHLMIAGLRSLGLAARYVSGYLRTTPLTAPGSEPERALVGADASHAWVAVYAPPHGWVEFDPTNNLVVDREHVVLGWGRDFSDVSPLRGVILGGGAHTLEVAVKVEPLAGLGELPEHAGIAP
jgi:transglutaminase-like putative cysteine protease